MNIHKTSASPLIAALATAAVQLLMHATPATAEGTAPAAPAAPAESAAPAAPAAPAAVPPAAPAPAPAAAAAPVAPAAATPPAASVEEKKHADLVKYARTQGYQQKMRDGQPFWCRDETPLGSRFAKQKCVTDAQLAEIQREAADLRQQYSQGGGQTCPKAVCN